LWMTGALTKSNVSSPMPRQTPSIGQKRVRPVLPVRRVVPRRVVVPERRIVPERRVIARPVPPMVRVRRVVLRKALARHQRVCGVPAKRYRWVLGRLSKGSIRKATIKFLGCVGCRYQRRGRYLCLQLPTRKRTSIRVVLDGYQTCRHGIGARHHRVLWRLKVLEPDALPDELYGCATF
jgi:hypothetical protein